MWLHRKQKEWAWSPIRVCGTFDNLRLVWITHILRGWKCWMVGSPPHRPFIPLLDKHLFWASFVPGCCWALCMWKISWSVVETHVAPDVRVWGRHLSLWQLSQQPENEDDLEWREACGCVVRVYGEWCFRPRKQHITKLWVEPRCILGNETGSEGSRCVWRAARG